MLPDLVNSQIVLKEPLSTRQTYYKIDANLDTAGKMVEGKMETFWVNKSPDTVPVVQMHLYMNAFRSKKSTFNKESGASHPGKNLITDGLISKIYLTGTVMIFFLPSGLSVLMMETLTTVQLLR